MQLVISSPEPKGLLAILSCATDFTPRSNLVKWAFALVCVKSGVYRFHIVRPSIRPNDVLKNYDAEKNLCELSHFYANIICQTKVVAYRAINFSHSFP